MDKLELHCKAVVICAHAGISSSKNENLQRNGVLAGEVLKRIKEYDLHAVEVMLRQ